jgi:RNA polymerase subunit RPABC4/transcription elongation factor Spt4
VTDSGRLFVYNFVEWKTNGGNPMICLKCRKEIEDLSMYCPNCGAPQFTPKIDEQITLELTDPMKSKVIIEKVENMTLALSHLREVTGLSIMELRSLLKELPAVLLSHLSKEDAAEKAQQLREAGFAAYADTGEASVNEESMESE